MGIGAFFGRLFGHVVHESAPGERIAVATVGDREVARTDAYKKVEGNVYFPPDTVDRSMLMDSDRTYVCPWKGLALYYDLKVDGQMIKDGAWYYPDPKDAAAGIRDHIAFDREIKVQENARASQ